MIMDGYQNQKSYFMPLEQVLEIMREGISQAVEYYCIDPHMMIWLEPSTELDVLMDCVALPEYNRATIRVNIAFAGVSANVWRAIGHEMTHLVAIESWELYEHLKLHLPNNEVPNTLHRVIRSADEKTSARLDRMWLRDRPMPDRFNT